MQRFLLHILLIAACVFGFSACRDHSDEPASPELPAAVHRTVLVYMLADNNLGTQYHFDYEDLNEMRQGVLDGGLNGGRLLVYYNHPHTVNGNPPQLIEITPDGEIILKTYPDDPELYSVEIGRMRQVLADMKLLAPAEEYGLVFWGHATAWMTEDGDMDRSITPRSYGNDRGKWMSLSSLGKALDGELFSFIYFDCCLMGSVEIAYEFRHNTPLIAASPTEVEGEGMPYQLNIPAFFRSGTPDVEGAARNTYTYLSEKGLNSQMVVIDTSALDDLAEASLRIFENVTDYPAELSSVQALSRTFSTFDPVYRTTCPVYDMADYMRVLCADRTDLLEDWQEVLDRCVIYKATTPRDFTGIPIRTYGGLGSFVIKKAADTTYRGYDRTLWWNDIVSKAPVFN